MYRFWGAKRWQLVFFLLLLLAGATGQAHTQEAQLSTPQLVEEIIQIHETYEEGEGPKSQNGQVLSNIDAVRASKKLGEKLGQQGIKALPAIKAAVASDKTPADARRALVLSMKGMSGSEVDTYLLELALQDSTSFSATAAIKAHADRNELAASPTEEQIAHFSDLILDAQFAEACRAARFIAIFQTVSPVKRFQPFITRFLREIDSKSDDPPQPTDITGIYREHILSYLLQGYMQDYSADAQPLLLAALERREDDSEAKKWLQLALAAAGDADYAPFAKSVVNDATEDLEVRSRAVDAYVRALGEAALPDLIRWKENEEVVLNKLHKQKQTLIADTAKHWISQLQEPGR